MAHRSYPHAADALSSQYLPTVEVEQGRTKAAQHGYVQLAPDDAACLRCSALHDTGCCDRGEWYQDVLSEPAGLLADTVR